MKKTVSSKQGTKTKPSKDKVSKSNAATTQKNSRHIIDLSLLSVIEKQILEGYAVVSPERPARTKMMGWLNKVRRQSDQVGIKSDEYREAILGLFEKKLLNPNIDGGGAVHQGPGSILGTITPLVESALQANRAYPLLAIAEDESSPYNYHSFQRFSSQASSFSSLYLLEQKVRLDVISGQLDEHNTEELPDDIWHWTTESAAKPYLQALPDFHRQVACVVGIQTLFYNFLPISEFRQTCLECAPDPTEIIDTLTTSLVLEGKLQGAIDLFDAFPASLVEDKQSKVARISLDALIATIQGEHATATTLVEKCIEEERSGTRKRLVFPNYLAFEIATLSLLAEGSPKSAQLFKSLQKTYDKQRRQTPMTELYDIAAMVTEQGEPYQRMRTNGMHFPADILMATSTRWHKRVHLNARDELYVERLQNVLMRCVAGGYEWATAELLTVLEQSISPISALHKSTQDVLAEASGEERHRKMGTVSLTGLITPLEKWETELRSLELLAPPEKKNAGKTTTKAGAKKKRLIWEVSDIAPESVQVTPVEQSMGKNGQWSGGRRVSLQRLKNNPDGFEGLNDQDLKAAETIRKFASYGWGGGGTRYETDQRTVYKLIGHPHVIDEEGLPVEIVERPAELRIDETGDKLRVKMFPKPVDHYVSSFSPGTNRLEVTHFTAAQRRLFDAIPISGMSIPLHAKERLLEAVAALAGDIQVQSDAASATVETLTGVPTPLCELEHLEHGVNVRFRVEPLENSSVLFDSGSGGAVVFVHKDGSNVAVKRDLDLERQELMGLINSSTQLSARFDGSHSVLIESIPDALEMIDELQQSNVRCIWLKGKVLKVSAKVASSQLSVKIKSAAEWFKASGELKVSEDEAIKLSQLLEMVRVQPKSRFIELDKGEFVALSEELRIQLEVMAAFSKPADGRSKKTDGADTTAKESPTSLHSLTAMALGPLLEGSGIKGDKQWNERVKTAVTAIDKPPKLPTTLQADLRPYQHEGFEWMTKLGAFGAGVCLADDMGLGKTVQTLAVLLNRASNGPALVVAPTSVAGNWLLEAQKFAPSLNVALYAEAGSKRQQMLENSHAFNLIITSYGLLHSDVELFSAVHWHTVVLDEAQAIKNASTQRAKAARSLKADMRIATTGTPIQNNLMDLHSLFDFLNPGVLGSQSVFRNRFALPIERNNDEAARQQLQVLAAPFILRRLKREVLKDLPSRTEINLSVELSAEEAALYEALRLEALESLEAPSTSEEDAEPSVSTGQRKIQILAQLTRLRRLCCNPKLIQADWLGAQSKLALFNSTLEELLANRHKVLVFSQFVDHLKIIEAELQNNKIAYQYLDGSTPAKKRQERVNAFQAGEGEVFLISLTAGGTGLNLTAADYVIHLDPWWNPAVEDQASDRAHRIGQTRPVTVYRMVTKGTIEAQIQELHGNKRDLAQSILSGSGSSRIEPERLLELLYMPVAKHA